MSPASVTKSSTVGETHVVRKPSGGGQAVGSRAVNLRRQYLSRTQGVVGLVMLSVFLFGAIAAPILTAYNPQTDLYLADRLAAPAWMGIFPAMKGLPRSHSESIPAGAWHADAVERSRLSVTKVGGQDTLSVDLEDGGSASISRGLSYTSDPPTVFTVAIPYKMETPEGGTVEPVLSLKVVAPSGREFDLWDSSVTPPGVDWTFAEVDSRDLFLKERLGLTFLDDPAPLVFGEKGGYRLVLAVSAPVAGAGLAGGVAEAPAAGAPLLGAGGQAPMRVLIGKAELRIPGRLHGLLGADHLGSDLWAQLVYGTRVSLLIGVLTAVISVAIGTLVGVVAGYVGGSVDEVLMRFTDIMLSIPLLPILIILGALFGKSIWNVVFLVAVFSWMGTARIVRSQTLSLKERAFVEAARAAGARSGYIIPVHVLPNVMPLVFAAFVLRIPTAIVTEATLSFLGLGDPRVPTWGRMLHNARGFGAFTQLAWWWILPPGLAITLLSLAFVFIGNTMNEIFNPRYRERS